MYALIMVIVLNGGKLFIPDAQFYPDEVSCRAAASIAGPYVNGLLADKPDRKLFNVWCVKITPASAGGQET